MAFQNPAAPASRAPSLPRSLVIAVCALMAFAPRIETTIS